jgi:hypothetical protein
MGNTASAGSAGNAIDVGTVQHHLGRVEAHLGRKDVHAATQSARAASAALRNDSQDTGHGAMLTTEELYSLLDTPYPTASTAETAPATPSKTSHVAANSIPIHYED